MRPYLTSSVRQVVPPKEQHRWITIAKCQYILALQPPFPLPCRDEQAFLGPASGQVLMLCVKPASYPGKGDPETQPLEDLGKGPLREVGHAPDSCRQDGGDSRVRPKQITILN